MRNNYKHRPGELLGPWTLREPLGIGGNAEVWRAVRQGFGECALKILFSRKPNAEPYRRFRDEVAILSELEGFAGILPMLEHCLPSQPSKSSPAWLALPIAQSVTSVLGTHPNIEVAIGAVAVIARTLATLADRRIFHRDIKPENLYALNGEWLIGDFGLVEYPTKDAFTTGERAPGAFHYLAPECLLDPNAPAAPVDVYALAKTLWVLSSNQRLPLQGHLNASVEPLRLGMYSPHLRIRQIEILLDRATHPTPELRPTMSQVASELEAWLLPQQVTPIVIDDAALANRATAIVNANVAKSMQRQERMDRAIDLCSRAETAMRDSLLTAFARFGVEAKAGASQQVNNVREVAELRDRQGRIYSCHPTCSVATQAFGAPNQPTIELLGGLEIQIEESGNTTILGYWALFDTERQLKTLWSRTRNAWTISAEEERELSAILQEIAGALPEAVASYVDRLQELSR